MRVCLVTNNPGWAGTEAQIASLAGAFRGAPGFALCAALFRPGQLVDALEALGVPVRVVPVRFELDLTAVWRLAKLLREWRIDVVHSHGYKANVIGAFAARLARVRPVIRTEHGLPEPLRGFANVKMELYLSLDRLVGRYLTDAIIAVSETVAAAARERLPGLPVVLIRNGIGAEARPRAAKPEARRALGLPPEGAVVGIVGRLVPVKDHATFLAAARRLAAREPATRFVIAGTGPLEGALKSAATALGLGDRVHFRYLPGATQAILDALDVLVFASRHEGMPYALLEALRVGVPVVATAVGGLAEALTNGHNALLVPPCDPDALADAIHRVLCEPELGRRLARQGRVTVEQRFSLTEMRERTATVYLEALRAARGAPSALPARAGTARLGR